VWCSAEDGVLGAVMRMVRINGMRLRLCHDC